MRSIWLIFGSLLLVLLGLRFFLRRPTPALLPSREATTTPIVLVAGRSASAALPGTGQRDSIVRFALRQLGTPYVWAGTSPFTGFDCSGFITYVFGHFGVPTPHATALLIDAGRPVPRAQARPGDIVVFTGTAEGSTTPGHAGIVISALGETPLRFVHASSARRESGVKVSQVENSDYERRFMQVRRVLEAEGASPVSRAASQPVASARPLPHPAGAVAALPAAAPEPAPVPTAPLPARVAPLPIRLRPRAAARATRATKRHHPTRPTATKAKPPTHKVARKPVAPAHKAKPGTKTKLPARRKAAPSRTTAKKR